MYKKGVYMYQKGVYTYQNPILKSMLNWVLNVWGIRILSEGIIRDISPLKSY